MQSKQKGLRVMLQLHTLLFTTAAIRFRLRLACLGPGLAWLLLLLLLLGWLVVQGFFASTTHH